MVSGKCTLKTGRYSSDVRSGSNTYLARPQEGCSSLLNGLKLVVGRCEHSATPIGVTLESVGDWEVRVRDHTAVVMSVAAQTRVS